MKKLIKYTFWIALIGGITYWASQQTLMDNYAHRESEGWVLFHYSKDEMKEIDKVQEEIKTSLDLDAVNSSLNEPEKLAMRGPYYDEIIIDESNFTYDKIPYFGIGKNGNRIVLVLASTDEAFHEVLITINTDGVVTNAETIPHPSYDKPLSEFIKDGLIDGDERLFNGDTFDKWYYEHNYNFSE